MEARSSALSCASRALEADPPACWRRWADIADLSDEDEECVEAAATVTPTSASRGRTSSASTTPFLEHSESRQSSCAEPSANSETRQTSLAELYNTYSETRQLNANAPDFVPTLTMVCPLVGLCVLPDCSGQMPASPVLAAAVAVPVPLPAAVGFREPEPQAPAPRAALPPAAPRGLAQLRKPAAGRKLRPAPLQTSFAPRRRAPAAPAPVQGEMPEATEEEWQHRVEMRQRSVALGKATSAYCWYRGLKTREEREEGEPATPNPTDRTVSKRHWKYLVQRWRIALHCLYVEDGNGSTLSTDDWRSTVTATTETGERSMLAIDGDDASSTGA